MRLVTDEMEESIRAERTDLFYELFEGREDVAFVDQPHPHQEKLEEGDMFSLVYLHLHGSTPIGIYPLEGGNRCKWICSDFDTSEAEELAWRYAEAWEYYGIQAWVETSRSKGYHVWVFADDWMSGTIARRAGLWVHELAEIEAIELNPKQELLETGGYGNCVRLPYPAAGAGTVRQVMWADRSTPLEIDDWLDQVEEYRTPVPSLQRLAALWKPKPVQRTQSSFNGDRTGGRGENNSHIVSVFRGETDVKKGERDLVFFTLASHLKGMGMDRDEAISVVQEVWEEQTKDKASFPYKEAVSKVHRVYNQG